MSLANLVNTAIDIVIYLIVARSIISFVPHDPHKPIFRFIYETTEPLLKPFRRFSIGGGGFGIDFSPLIAIFLLQVVVKPVLFYLIGLLWRIG